METKLVIAGWVGVLLMIALRAIIDWTAARYGVPADAAPWRTRPTRRWYGVRCHIQRRAEDLTVDPDGCVYEVLDYSDDHTDRPWVLVVNTDDRISTGAFWYPVTGFTPYSVSRFRPSFARRHGVPWPVLFRHETVPGVRPIHATDTTGTGQDGTYVQA